MKIKYGSSGSCKLGKNVFLPENIKSLTSAKMLDFISLSLMFISK